MTWFEARTADWLGLDEAVGRMLASATPLSQVEVPASQGLSFALGAGVHARATLPPFDNSAMDGYAVRGVDIEGATEERPVTLDVVTTVRAGTAPGESLREGQAVRIMTGAPVPPGADTVVRVEHTDAETSTAGRVVIRADSDVGRNIRPMGQDMHEGELVLEAGTSITSGVLAVVAGLGHDSLMVHRKPRVGILSSGDELRSLADFDDVRSGKGIPETNSAGIGAAVLEAGGEPVLLGTARDNREEIIRHVESAFDCDVLVTTGGASMGEADLFKRVLLDLGLEIDFWRVRIRPGSPFSFASLPRGDAPPLPVLGLPGNPASAYVTFQLLARPYLLALAGHRRTHRRVVSAVAGEPLVSTPRLAHFHRVMWEAGDPIAADRIGSVRLTGPQGSGLIRSLALAEGLAVVPEGVARIEVGEPVEVIVFDDGPGRTHTPGYSLTSKS